MSDSMKYALPVLDSLIQDGDKTSQKKERKKVQITDKNFKLLFMDVRAFGIHNLLNDSKNIISTSNNLQYFTDSI